MFNSFMERGNAFLPLDLSFSCYPPDGYWTLDDELKLERPEKVSQLAAMSSSTGIA